MSPRLPRIWDWLARVCQHAADEGRNHLGCGLSVPDDCYGLCVVLSNLRWMFSITDEEHYAMCATIRDNSWSGRGYRWPLTPEGHAQRAAFCRRQAAKCRAALRQSSNRITVIP